VAQQAVQILVQAVAQVVAMAHPVRQVVLALSFFVTLAHSEELAVLLRLLVVILFTPLQALAHLRRKSWIGKSSLILVQQDC
jgi:hypothetical protein